MTSSHDADSGSESMISRACALGFLGSVIMAPGDRNGEQLSIYACVDLREQGGVRLTCLSTSQDAVLYATPNRRIGKDCEAGASQQIRWTPNTKPTAM